MHANISAAIDLAEIKGAQIINNSWGWIGAPSQIIEDSINAALDAGNIIIFIILNKRKIPPMVTGLLQLAPDPELMIFQ